MQPLAGVDPVPHSRWIDLEQCISLVGAPAAPMTDSGRCTESSPRSVGLSSITQVGSLVIVVHNPSAELWNAPIPTSVTSGFPPLAQLEVATFARNSVRLLQTPSIEPVVAVTTTTAAGVPARGFPQRLNVAQLSRGSKRGMVVTVSISDVSIDGFDDLSFSLHLFNNGTLPYDCDLLRAQMTTAKGLSARGIPLDGSKNACLSEHNTVPPGDQVTVPFFIGGAGVADTNVIVLPYGPNANRAIWGLAGADSSAP